MVRSHRDALCQFYSYILFVILRIDDETFGWIWAVTQKKKNLTAIAIF